MGYLNAPLLQELEELVGDVAQDDATAAGRLDTGASGPTTPGAAVAAVAAPTPSQIHVAVVPEPVAGVNQPGRRRATLGRALNLGVAATMAVVVLGCLGVLGLVVTGHHIEQVVTGSMQPVIPIGSIVVSERVPADHLVTGDVLVFPKPSCPGAPASATEVIVHRIVELRQDADHNVVIRTKGDYNAEADCWTVKRAGSAFADRARWVVPGGGVAADWLRRIGFFGLLAVGVGLVGRLGFRQVRRVLTDDSSPPAPLTGIAPNQSGPGRETA